MIAVVVPTRDRPERLRRCLAALRAQDTEVEAVVVDDGSRREREVAAVAAAAGARLVRRQGAGPAAARNAGARASAAPVVCFTDDDCEPDSAWAGALAAPILAAEAESASGPTVAAPGASAADRAWEAIVAHLQRRAAAPGTPSPGFAPTANLACARGLLERLPFDESFPGAAGEDREWATRAAAAGAAPVFVPEARVVHRPELGAASFLGQQYRYGRGAARYREARGGGLGSASFYAGLLRSGFAAGAAPGALVCLAQAATAAGAAVERLAGSRARPAAGASARSAARR